MTERQRRKQHWFDAVREAAERASGRPAPGYACPICARWFTSIDDLTFEHAPPEKIGGRELALTCNECNSTAGHGVDAELAKAHDVREWSRGRSLKPLRGRLTFEGIPVTVDVERTPEQVTILGLPEYSDPANTAAHWEAFDRIAASGEPYFEPLHFSFAGYHERHARIALLRSAYVAAFALLGYRYALRPSLEVVREQIRNPDDELTDRFSLHRAEPIERRGIAWVEAPKNLESVVVQIDDHLVFLPGMKAEGAIYEHLAARKVWPPRRAAFAAMRLKPLGWPRRPHHLMDSEAGG